VVPTARSPTVICSLALCKTCSLCTPRLKVYVFNVTNAEEFASGIASKARVEEIGPFVYTARQEKDVVEWGANEETITFR